MPEDEKKELSKDDQKVIEQGKFLGVEEEMSPLAKKLAGKFPGLVEGASARQKQDEVLFESLQKKLDFLMKMEKDRKNIFGDDYEPDAKIQETMNALQSQLITTLNGISPEEIRQAQASKDIVIDDNLKFSEEQLTNFIQNPDSAREVFESLLENDLGDTANKFSDFIAQNLSGNFSNNFSPQDSQPLSQPTPEPVNNPESVGSDDPISNIKNNIASFKGGAREKVKAISSSLKSNIQTRRIA